MKLIAVTPPQDVKDEHQYIALLIAEGFIVHCRKPEKKAVELAHYLRQISPDFRNSVAIHDHHELADDMGIKRLHFQEKKRLETKFSFEKHQNFFLSTSVHDVDKLAKEPLKPFNYVFCGPVYDSITKTDYRADERWQKKLPETLNFDKIAISGITPERMVTVNSWGYDGAAFSGYLWDKPEKIEKRINKIKKVWLKDLTF